MNLNEITNTLNDDAVLRESSEYFQSQGLSFLNEGIKEIVSRPEYVNMLADSLTEGLDADSSAEMSQLIKNSAQSITESVAGIAPLTSLTMPVIRKLWPRVAMKDAIKTVVAKAPIFSIAYLKPFAYKLIEKNGELVEQRVALPRGAFAANKTFGMTADFEELTSALTKNVTVTLGTNVGKNDDKVTVTADTDGFTTVSLTDEPGKFPLDRNFVVNTVKVGDTTVKVNSALALTDNLSIPVYDKTAGLLCTLIVNVDLYGAKAKLAAVGAASGTTVVVDFTAHLSSQWNEVSTDFGFTIEKQDITIGTGEHFNAPLSLEQIQDYRALYDIDAAAELSDIMTNTLSQKLDFEIINFMTKCLTQRPLNKEFADYSDTDMTSAARLADFTYAFDVAPAAGFAGSPTAWREELKPVIDHAANDILQETYFSNGVFVIVGNPVDTALLNTIDWQYKGGQSGNVDGTAINYTIGVYQGTYTYKVVSTRNFQPGKLFMGFIPAGEKQLTQCYFPYSFVVEKGAGYRSANHKLVPSVMMTKRHTMFEYTPATALIIIVGNDGQNQFNAGNLYTNQFVSKA